MQELREHAGELERSLQFKMEEAKLESEEQASRHEKEVEELRGMLDDARTEYQAQVSKLRGELEEYGRARLLALFEYGMAEYCN